MSESDKKDIKKNICFEENCKNEGNNTFGYFKSNKAKKPKFVYYYCDEHKIQASKASELQGWAIWYFGMMKNQNY